MNALIKTKLSKLGLPLAILVSGLFLSSYEKHREKEKPKMPPVVATPAVQNPKIPKNQTYSQISKQILFQHNKPGTPKIAENLSNIKQGAAGDCYFLSSLIAVARRSPDTIRSLVRENGDGTYSASFHGLLDGTRGTFSATVTGDLPVNKRGEVVNNWIEVIDGRSVSWAAIIEKLWAAVNGNSYSRIDGIGNSDANDRDIANGLYALTGKAPEERALRSIPFRQVLADFDQGVIVLGTGTKSGPLVRDHAYAVVGVNANHQTVTLRDPEKEEPYTISFQALKKSNANQYLTVQIDR